MKLEDIRKIALVGAGDMGHGIAEVALRAGYQVALRDVEQRFVDKGLQRIGENLARLTRKKRVSEADRKEMMGRIKTFVDLGEAVKDADFVIEAVPEVMDIKRKVFRELDKLAPKDAVLASNSSSMSITEIASVTSRPEKVVGMHFFNPAAVMKLVEVIKGDETSEETMQLTLDLAARMNKIPVRVEKDSAGFIYNRIGAPGLILLGAIVDRGIAAPEEIDARLKQMGMPMGPYELMDYVGLDIVYHGSLYVAERLSSEYGPPKWLREKIEAGDLGKKTGKGIYDWSKGRPAIDLARAKEDFDANDLIAIQVNEATKLLEEGVVKNPDDIDKAMIHGGRVAFGPFQLARRIGYDKLARRCEELAKEYGVDAFKPTETLKIGEPAPHRSLPPAFWSPQESHRSE